MGSYVKAFSGSEWEKTSLFGKENKEAFQGVLYVQVNTGYNDM